MKRFLKNLLSVLHSLIYFSITKVFHWKTFQFRLIERFSPSTEVTLVGPYAQINLGNKVTAHTGVRLKSMLRGRLLIEDQVRFNYGCMVMCREYVRIGIGVGFGPNVLIFDHDHDYRVHDGVGPGATKFRTGFIEIGERSWIGANVVLLRNTKIGKNCVVAAGCVLGNCDIPDNSLVYQKKDTQIKVIPR